MYCYTYYESPVGALLLAGDTSSLRVINFPGEKKRRRLPQPGWKKNRSVFKTVCEQLDAYFQGRLTVFDIPIAYAGTPFQRNVWQALRTIAYGRTWSYGRLAKAIGNAKACRAVGAANRVNPLPIVIPCHRVIGADGKLTGFGGGLEIKRWLLQLEGALD
ncbi:MAG: methylated-DNA--[protein]-cysteine S-methyltransferase [Desulfobacteraceae bacterium]|nr:methylated-DNA--[protein]-cysteine S-methyltransferase [Desulfobacteraceae bacterium]